MYYNNYLELRDKKGLTDYKVADKSGVSRSTISEWKTGEHTPNLENLKKIAISLNVTLDDLVKEEAL